MKALSSVPEWATSNTKVAYPFMPLPDLIGEGDVRTLFADAYIVYGGDVQVTGPLKLSELRYSAGSYGITILDGVGNVFLDAVQATSRTWGPWTALSWESDSPRFIRVSVLLNTALAADVTFPVVPDPAPAFVDRCVEWRSKKVLSFKLQNLPFPVSLTKYDGDVKLQSGYNSTVTVEEEDPLLAALAPQSSVRPASRIRFTAASGVGLGLYPSECAGVTCGDPAHPVIHTINGLAPDSSKNYNLSGDPCIWLERPHAEDNPDIITVATLRLHNGCSVCCACSEFVTYYNSLRGSWLRFENVYGKLGSAVAQYNALVAQLKTIETAKNKVCAVIKATAKPGWTVNIQVVIANNTRCPIAGCNADVVVPADAIEVGDGYLLLPGRDRIPAAPGGFSTAREIPPATFIVYEYEVFFPEGARHDGLIVPVSMTGQMGEHLLYASATTTLKKSFNKDMKV